MSYNELLIKEVHKYKCLYDNSLKDYRNVQKKELVWERVGKTLGTNGASCKRRWKTLRDTYKKTKRANELAYGSCSPPPEKKYKFHDALSFLDKCKDSRSITRNDEIIKEDDTCFTEELILENDEIIKEDATSFTEELISVNDIIKENAPSFTEELISVNPTTTQDFEVSYCGWMDNTVAKSDLDIQSSSSTGMPTSSQRRADDEIKKTFAKAMGRCVVSLNELAKTSKRNSTFLLFESFAEKIIDANLSRSDINKLETKVMALVYEELSKYSEN